MRLRSIDTDSKTKTLESAQQLLDDIKNNKVISFGCVAISPNNQTFVYQSGPHSYLEFQGAIANYLTKLCTDDSF